MNDLETKYQFEAIWPSIKNGAILRSGLSKNVGSKMKVFIRDEVFHEILSVRTINESRLYELIEATEQKLKTINENKKNFLFGNAQKFINLTLKSMWLVGWLEGVPPHFPVDRMIQSYIKRPDGFSASDYPFKWTDMSRDHYSLLIAAPKRTKKYDKNYKDVSLDQLAIWELTTYFNHNNL